MHMALVEGNAYWASVTTPNTKFEPVYTVNLVIDDSVAKEFAAKGHKIKQMDEGPSIVIKRKVTDKSGKPRPAPKLVDSEKQPLNEMVGNGSRVKVQYHEWETSNQYGDFKGLDFQAMQVIDLIPYGDRTDDGEELGIDDGDEF
tara:strand:- start:162 stop:593 length:432 start_codon:yes stop_codon:yes gene_type:complete